MRRYGKCVGKEAFDSLVEARNAVVRNACHGHRTYGVYTCPKCLDFHLTSKYDNRDAALRWGCVKTITKTNYPTAGRLIHKRTLDMHSYRKRGVPYKEKDTRTQLSLSEQKEALKQLNK